MSLVVGETNGFVRFKSPADDVHDLAQSVVTCINVDLPVTAQFQSYTLRYVTTFSYECLVTVLHIHKVLLKINAMIGIDIQLKCFCIRDLSVVDRLDSLILFSIANKFMSDRIVFCY